MTSTAAKGGTTSFDPKVFAGSLTQRPGAYQMLDAGGRIIYVGKAKNLRRRVGSYFHGRPLDAKTMAMVRKVADIRVTVTQTETEALILEYNLIKRHKPRFNVLLRDDKSYPYIRVRTDQEFPRVSFYRGSRRAAGRLFGPYPSAGSVRETLNQLQKLFQVRQCEDSYFANRTRPCLQYQIKRCTAPCVDFVAAEEYQRDIEHAMMFLQGRNEAITGILVERMESAAQQLDFERAAQYRDQLAKLKAVETRQLVSRPRGDIDAIGLVSDGGVNCVAVLSFRGGRLLGSRNHFPRAVAATETEEIMRAFVLQYYGRREPPHEILVSHAVSDAGALADMLTERVRRRVLIKHRVRGDRAAWLEMVLTNAAQGIAQRRKSGAVMSQQLEALADCLELREIPERLACFDVSHTGGDSAVAACVVFGPQGPLKSGYRRFNISGITGGDDYGAMTQALERWSSRLLTAEAGVPDVLFVDGGQGQLSVASVATEGLRSAGMRLVAVAKGAKRQPGRERLFLEGRRTALKLSPDAPALHLILQLRDEAHRFAVLGHRARRQKKHTASPLEEIPGVGPKRRRELLRQFGGLQAVTRAGVDDLMRVKGISRHLAKLIYEHVHSD